MELTFVSPTALRLDISDEVLRRQNIALVDAAATTAALVDQYGFPEDLFAERVFFQTSSKLIRIAARPFEISAEPPIDRMGIDFLRIDMAVPRLTTSAAMTFARWATRNVVDTTKEQCMSYLRREPIVLDDGQVARCSERGFVLVRHLHHGLGMGFLESTSPADEHFGRMRSLYPSAFAADLEQTSAFGNPS